jgi:hypothetical protein
MLRDDTSMIAPQVRQAVANTQFEHGDEAQRPREQWDLLYTAVPANVPPGVLPPLPVYGLPFQLQANGTHDIWFPGIQTGTTWDVTVHCANGVNSPTTKVVY